MLTCIMHNAGWWILTGIVTFIISLAGWDGQRDSFTAQDVRKILFVSLFGPVVPLFFVAVFVFEMVVADL